MGRTASSPAAEAGFSYRRSQLGHVVVLETTCALVAADPTHLEAETEELYKWRREGTPFNQPCCGSVFQNPVLPADWAEGNPRTSGQCIDATGLKGLRVGGVEVSPMHANYFVNTGEGTAADVIALMRSGAAAGAGTVGSGVGAGGEAYRYAGRRGHARSLAVSRWSFRKVLRLRPLRGLRSG